MTITALPTPAPSRQDSVNFSERADAFLGALPNFALEANALAVEVNNNKTIAQNSANTATAAANAAVAAAGASVWVASTNYATGAVVYSPIDFLTYRRKISGVFSTDPSNDPTRWAQVTGTGNVSTNSSGFLGLGTTTPLTLLHIKGVQATMVLEDTSAVTDQKIWRIRSRLDRFAIDTAEDDYSVAQQGYALYRTGLDVTRHIWSTEGVSRMELVENILILRQGPAVWRSDAGLQFRYNPLVHIGYISARTSDTSARPLDINDSALYLDESSRRIGINKNNPTFLIDAESTSAPSENIGMFRIVAGGTRSFTVNHAGLPGAYTPASTTGDIVVRSENAGLHLVASSGSISLGSYTQTRLAIETTGQTTFFGSSNFIMNFESYATSFSSVLNMGSSGTGGKSTLSAPQDFQLSVNNLILMNAKSTGLIGFGTTTPATQWEFYKSTVSRLRVTHGNIGANVELNAGVSFYGLGTNNASLQFVIDNVEVGIFHRSNSLFVTNANMQIKGSRLYIGKDGSNKSWIASADSTTEPGILAIGFTTVSNSVTDVEIRTAGVTRMNIDNSGIMYYGGVEVGYRGIPLTATSGITAARSIAGKGYIATGNVTINGGVFQQGDVFTIVSNSASPITVIQGASMTNRLAGTTLTGTRTIAPYGSAVVFFVSGSECRVSGAGVS